MFYAKEVEQIEFFAVSVVVVVGKGQKYLGIEYRLDSKGQIHDSSKNEFVQCSVRKITHIEGFSLELQFAPKARCLENYSDERGTFC